jgi:hypothetical protein
MSNGYSLAKYFLLWFCYIILFVAAVLGLEIIEGSKITSTEYSGLRNSGIIFFFLTLTGGIFLYVITFLPLSLLLNWLVRSHIIRIIIYVIVAVAGGLLLFVSLYGSFLLDGRGYGLNSWSACIIFGIVGLIYGYMEHLLNNKIRQQSSTT